MLSKTVDAAAAGDPWALGQDHSLRRIFCLDPEALSDMWAVVKGGQVQKAATGPGAAMLHVLLWT